MHRLAYRNFGDHESLVANHAVATGSAVGIRWYELRNPGTTPTLFQSGTYAPDMNFRWLGSVAMDQSGDMALAFSVSSLVLKPGIRYVGRTQADSPGVIGGEVDLKAGVGTQAAGNSRWGRYSAMVIDPVDDCTFFYTNAYYKFNGTSPWSTWVSSFKFASCGVAADFSLSAMPASLEIAPAQMATSVVATAVVSGTPGAIVLSVSGVPPGATASLDQSTVAAGGSVTLTVRAGTARPGAYAVTVTSVSGAVTHSTPIALTVLAPVRCKPLSCN
jgi:hypothetical protein